MADLAQLAIEVDSSSAKTASGDLDKLTTSAGATEAATVRLKTAVTETATAQETLRTKTILTTEQIETAREGTEKFEATQDKFYASLKKSADTIGMSKSQVAAYNAALLDLGNNPSVQKYIAQLKAAEDAQNAMKNSAGGLVDRLDNQLLRTVIRAGASFAIMTVGIQGTIAVVELLTNAEDHLQTSLTAAALAAAHNGETANGLTDRLQTETEALKLMGSGSAEAATQQQKLASIKEQISALGPAYTTIMTNENLSIQEQIKLVKELNEKTKEQLQQQVMQIAIKGPEDSFGSQVEQFLGMVMQSTNFSGIGQSLQDESMASRTDAVTKWQKKIQDLRTEIAKLDEPSAFESEVDKINAKLKEQSDAIGKTAGQLVYEKEIRLGATEAVAREAKARQDAIDAAKGGISVKEKLIEQLEQEVGAEGRITSQQVAYRLSQLNLTASDKARIEALIAMSNATEEAAAKDKYASEEARANARNQAAADRDAARAAKEKLDAMYQVLLLAAPDTEAGEKYYQQTKSLSTLLDNGAISAQQYSKAVVKVKDDYIRLKAEGSDTLQALVDLTDTATAQMGKAFGDFVTTGKLDFASLIDSILADYARMEAQKGITEFFGYVLSLVPAAGGASGASGVGSGTGASSDLPSSSYSGLAAGPTVAPLAGGSSLGGPSISAPVTVNISNGAGGIQSSVQGGTQQGQDLGQKLRGAIVQVLIDEQRPGGALNSRG